MEKSRLPPYSPTVPGGDTPCVTAGDARKGEPVEREALLSSDTGGVEQHPHLLLSLNACSATLPASDSSTVSCPRVLPRSARASPAVKHGAPPPEAGFYEDHAYYLKDEIPPLQV